jgi:hypothetical protein
MAASPVIMPLTAPRKVGLWSIPKDMSRMTQANGAVAVARLVLMTAVDASAKYGPSPLKLGRFRWAISSGMPRQPTQSPS